jgi:hypothetical protein
MRARLAPTPFSALHHNEALVFYFRTSDIRDELNGCQKYKTFQRRNQHR